MGEQVLADGDAPRAATIFRQIREMAPDNPEVIGGLARALIAGGEIDEARTIARCAAARAGDSKPAIAPGPGGARAGRGSAGGRHRRARGAARRQPRRP